MQIDETDRALITCLQTNARQPVADLARTLGLARTTVQARLDRLERSGTIIGYTARLGAAVDAKLHATALVSIEPRSSPAVLARLRSLPGVRVVHTTSGRFDLLVQIAADTTEELDETLDKIGEARGVKSSESLIHLSTKLDRRG
ncbi:Lrp/AsnC family transcriptional regulator [Sulfitobacter sp. SK011]|uniref:Lrp/AsnC family transcriptional regulator n=1 Tax=Sulfitobacter sp. SK011 TaxID=1389004 RepID=UPI000E0C3F52|nr:Lrp/AsnC family transcriptional regulator [Sulfitobacter sp. SK011]AXI44227.1 AsnC family transcriptional regulator [Sulfitobacter sp. SK011]